MKPSLQPGVALTRRITIDRARTIGFMGEEARVYATPSMILDIEHTCRELILQHADAGEDRSASRSRSSIWPRRLPGMTVEISGQGHRGRGAQGDVRGFGPRRARAISAGTHARFVVDMAKTIERIKAKAAKRATEMA